MCDSLPPALRFFLSDATNLKRGERAGGAHVSRRHVRIRVAGCAASAAACWANGRDAAALYFLIIKMRGGLAS